MLNDGNMLLFDGLLPSLAAQRPPLAARLELHGAHGFAPERRPPVRPAGDARPGAEARGPAGREPRAGPRGRRARTTGPAHEQLIRAGLLAWWPARSNEPAGKVVEGTLAAVLE